MEPFHTLTARRSGIGGAMELFRAEKIAIVEDQFRKTCRLCTERLHLVRAIVDSDTGAIVHLFECQCGECIWID
jgi:hypothetical protein